MKFGKKITVLLALTMLLVACGKNTESVNKENVNNGKENSSLSQTTDEKKLNAITSFFVLEDFARRIGGEKVEVVPIIPKGQAPHGWEPSPQDIAKLQDSDVFIYNGAGLESWTDKVIEGIDTDKTILVEASEGVELIEGHSHNHEGEEAHDHEGEEAHDHEGEEAHDHEGEEAHDHEGEEAHDHEREEAHGMDPHVWTSPKNAIILAENIYKAFSEKDPNNQAYYEENYKKLEAELLALDAKFTETLGSANSHDIVVSHEAYGYMAKEYNLNQVPIEGINSETEPDPKTMQKIIEFVKENKVTTIFTEPLKDSKVADTIAKETGANVAVLDPLEGLQEGESLETTDYIQLMEENLKELEKALVE